MAGTLNNFNIIITGGTGDLGRVVVREFINKGANVVTNYRSAGKYNHLKDLCGDTDRLVGFKADLIRESQVREFFKEFENRFKRLDVFIHIAGGFWMGPDISETPLDKWNFMMDLNLTSTFLCCREAFKIMKDQCSGRIFSVSAKTALELPANMGAYAVSKAAVLALTRLLANEGKKYNIQASSILPSIIDTPANKKAMPDSDFTQWVKPKEVADLLTQLCRPESRALSHSAIKVYGQL